MRTTDEYGMLMMNLFFHDRKVDVKDIKDIIISSCLLYTSIIRGSGLNGLTGMSVVQSEYAIPVVRPLLDVTCLLYTSRCV